MTIYNDSNNMKDKREQDLFNTEVLKNGRKKDKI